MDELTREVQEALALIRAISDYPAPGILFQDITPLLSNAEAFSLIIDALASKSCAGEFIAGVEARGFILGSPLAFSLQRGFIPIRKKGKLPYTVISRSYGLEYGSDVLEIHSDAISPGSKIVLVDDVLATGGTIIASIELIEELGGEVQQVLLLSEIKELNGRQRIQTRFPSIEITSLLSS